LNAPTADRLRFLSSINSDTKLIEIWHKNAIYFYNNVEGDEELHEDEVAAKLVGGETIERVGKYWTITQVDAQMAVSASRPLDVLRVYLQTPGAGTTSQIPK
jgi:hypothetical protein